MMRDLAPTKGCDEGPWIKEWIEFHQIQGVEHFYLYNNNSTDDYLDVLEPYLKSGKVTLTDWPYTYAQQTTENPHIGWLNVQTSAYDHCLQNFAPEASWVAFLDLDEFLFCCSGKSLPEFLKQFTEYGGLCVNWLLFGTSGVYDIPEGKCMIELLTKCARRSLERNRRVKSIIQPKYTLRAADAHHFEYIDGWYAVTPKKRRHDFDIDVGNPSFDSIRINHYWTRTEKYFIEKKCKSREKRRSVDNPRQLHSWAASYNIEENKDILQFVPALRQAMGFDESTIEGRLQEVIFTDNSDTSSD